MEYKVNDIIYYPVPGCLFSNPKPGTVDVESRIIEIFDIQESDGIIVGIEFEMDGQMIKMGGKLLNSKNYKKTI